MNEEQLAIARLKDGDLAGLEWLVHQYQVQAVHSAYLIVGERAMAEDIAQSTFLQAAEKIGQFDSSRPFRPWFLRCVINNAIKTAKRQNRQISLDGEENDNVHPLANWLVDPSPNPEAILDTEETRQTVEKALACLIPEQRAAITLKYFLELSDAETATRLGRPLTTVKWWLHIARKHLRKLLHSKDDHEVEL